MCFYTTKWFSYDFGNYSEIVLMYDNRILNRWDEIEPDNFIRFWSWFSGMECVDLENKTITKEIQNAYSSMIKLRNRGTIY